ncbi:MAG: cupin domain-containing protein [Rhodospirillaceae bacterium]|nr:cupin domain-containing protein [Rhodospirillaceae bacterium]
MTADIGERLKTIRGIYNFSQRELARRAGVTNSTISLIEQNRVSPSVDSLKKVLEGFPLTLIDFFTMDMESKETSFFSRKDLVELSDGQASLLLVGATRKDRKLRVLHEIYPPGGNSGDTMISHPGEEAGVITKGSIQITVGKEVRVLHEGEAYYIDSQIPHAFNNISDEVCEIISAATPPNF